ncbi:uncharacterized protein K452DRAFT_220321 [Aplosporella prunicola CBS 121167]|uniref:G-protein coupled receptors family 1 profile domain-containing protein n=1 Tax=Aplosporella prunicola CBS 121167 TaxID=1176127 RepID=A0A6A6BQ32_9PEZI|nr:uncharacterized protein K452DRAFT_220321 [Aplosporella prunicola CBS 121167]KAF2146242.1 hypothetical protein K452DRAFT_220321 [Aplosporella prunicola CBS 121167]
METQASESASLSPLPPVLRRGLPAVAAFGILSFVASSTLFILLAYRLFFKYRREHGVQLQFIVLIFNLLLADIQQSMAFLLNVEWLVRNEIAVGTTTCWAQGWFVSIGDLASGIWTIAIGLHTFASVACNYRLGAKSFYATVASLWAFVYIAAIVGVVRHPHDLFVRAGAWCWINREYNVLRLWTHYIWIFLAEFGTLFIYAFLFLKLHLQLRQGSSQHHFRSPAAVARAQRAAKVLLIYPIVYVICTLPLASARMSAITKEPNLAHLCVAGAMITCNGWLDVLVFVLTRRVLDFADDAQEPHKHSRRTDSVGNSINVSEAAAEELMDTFHLPFWNDAGRWGTTTVIEASTAGGRNHGRTLSHHGILAERSVSRQSSTERLFGSSFGRGLAVKAETTVEVRNEPVELTDVSSMAPPAVQALKEKERLSMDSGSSMRS